MQWSNGVEWALQIFVVLQFFLFCFLVFFLRGGSSVIGMSVCWTQQMLPNQQVLRLLIQNSVRVYDTKNS